MRYSTLYFQFRSFLFTGRCEFKMWKNTWMLFTITLIGYMQSVPGSGPTRYIRYANGVHLSAISKNTALFQWIRCEPLGDNLIYRTCAVLSHIARKMNNVCIVSHDQVTHDIILPDILLNLHLECDMGWYRYTSHSENHSTEFENMFECLQIKNNYPLQREVDYRRQNLTYVDVRLWRLKSIAAL